MPALAALEERLDLEGLSDEKRELWRKRLHGLCAKHGVDAVSASMSAVAQATGREVVQLAAVLADLKRRRRPKAEVAVEDADVLREMLAIGVTESRAKELLAENGAPACREQLAALPFRKADDPPAVYVKSVQGDWAMPRALLAQRRVAAQRRLQAEAQERERRERAQAEELEQRRKLERQAYLDALDERARAELEALAEKRAKAASSIWGGRRPIKPVLDHYLSEIVYERLERERACPA